MIMGYILITGTGGFIGSNLLHYIRRQYPLDLEKIVLLSDHPPADIKSISPRNYRFTVDDFLIKGVDKLETVIHLGAFIPKDHSQANWKDENARNIINTEHLVKNLPSVPERFIYISTTDVYMKGNGIIDENNTTSPLTFYGKCKLKCEDLIIHFCNQYQVIPQILRLGNIYGTGERAFKKLIPETIRHLLNGESPIVYGTGEERRNFYHVLDCVTNIWIASKLTEYPGPVNIVSSKSAQIKEIVEMLIHISKASIPVQFINTPTKQYDVVFDNSRMIKYFYPEKVDLYKGLAAEFEYAKSNQQQTLL